MERYGGEGEALRSTEKKRGTELDTYLYSSHCYFLQAMIYMLWTNISSQQRAKLYCNFRGCLLTTQKNGCGEDSD